MPVADTLTAVRDLIALAPGYQLTHDYDEGRHSWAFASEAFLKDYRWVAEQARENLCPGTIHAFTDRVDIEAWEGDTAAADALEEQVGLRRVLNLAIRESWRAGDGWVLAWPDAQGVLRPHYHQAHEVTYRRAPDDPDDFAWVAKAWTVEDGPKAGHGRVNLYYPDRLERWVTTERVVPEGETAGRLVAETWPLTTEAWEPLTDDEGPDTIVYGQGRAPKFTTVPWSHVAHDATKQGGRGRSILRDVIPLQDGLNHSVSVLIVGGESFAQPLRALMNWRADPRIDPATGEVTTRKVSYNLAKSKILAVEGNGPLIQLDPPDATKLTAVQDAFAAKIARVVGVPPYDVAPDIGNVPSGAALRILTNRRTAAVKDFTTDNTPAVARLLDLLGVPATKPVWADPTPTDEAEELEKALQRKDLGFSLDDNLTEMGVDADRRKDIVKNAGTQGVTVGQLAIDAYNTGQDPAALTGM